MVRVLYSRAGHSGFESYSVLIFFTFVYVLLLKINFIFKQDLDLEPVKVNSTTSRVMCNYTKKFFSFLSIYAMVNSILIRFLTVHIGITGDYILALV